jgi:tRNA-splicing endonuclease subunit Sen2
MGLEVTAKEESQSPARSQQNDMDATTIVESNGNMDGSAKKKTSETTPSRLPKQKRPNYHELHARPMPLSVYPIPTFIPHNPLSLLRIAYVVLRGWIFPPSSHATMYSGYFSAATQSVHVTDPATVRALWEMGFFGTGTLSRSEPNWLSMERRRLGLVAFMTAEEVTAARRKVRMEFKRERARLEREVLEEQKRKESAMARTLTDEPKSETAAKTAVVSADSGLTPKAENPRAQDLDLKRPGEATSQCSIKVKEMRGDAHELVQEETQHEAPEQEEPVNQEHLQLSLPEAFYLSYAIGTLKIVDPESTTSLGDNQALFQLFRQMSYFPPASASKLEPDDPFLMSYAVYHHFRSLGWVVREGVKFAVDYLLYERGPVFTHATFAIMIVPSYTDPYWYATVERAKEVERKMARKSWHWLHCANRVQTNVVKTLVLAYVDVPAPIQHQGPEKDIGKLLHNYKIREFALRRWSANRNRD